MSNAHELREAVSAFRAEHAPKAYIDIGIDQHRFSEPPVRVVIYPRGVTQDGRFSYAADSFEEAVDLLPAQYAEHADRIKAETVRNMALEIIRLTADGSCTDAALRLKFSDREVTDFGEEACAEADEIASNGPFSIRTITQNANAA